MDKNIIEKLSLDQQKKIAVAYLMRDKDKRPKSLVNLFEKIDLYEGSAKDTDIAIGKATEALSQLQSKFYHIMGSIEVLTDLIAEGLENTDEKTIIEWCEAYRPPPSVAKAFEGVDLPGRPNVHAGDIDIAGSTSH